MLQPEFFIRVGLDQYGSTCSYLSLALRSPRLEDPEFKANLGYIVRSYLKSKKERKEGGRKEGNN